MTEALRREGHPVEEEAVGIDDYLGFVRTLQARLAATPTIEARPADDILYDADGLPR